MPGQRTLYVLRHAKSSWGDATLDDRDRPLAPRGQRAVKALAQYVETTGIQPAIVICSSALRTRETLDGVAPEGERLIEPALYSASASDLLDRLHQIPEETPSVMVIGHNPTLQILVLRLADGKGPVADGSDLHAVRHKFPTGALATLSFAGTWSELGPGGAELVALVRPKDLH
jgi:phosphohistidine phosphatase